MVELTNAEIDAATERGRKASLTEPRAVTARYDDEADRIVVELTNGCMFSFPPRLAQGLGSASRDHVAEVEVQGAGYGLHWKSLDVDLSIPGLLAGVFGTRAHMARLAGEAKSPAKATAARANGAKGGRPRASASG